MKHLNRNSKRSMSSRPSFDLRSLRKLLPSRRILLDISMSGVVAVGSILVLMRLRSIGERATTLVSDGRRVFSPGQLVSEQAYAGIVIVLASLAVILVAAVLGRRSSSTIVLTVVFAVVCLGAATFAFATYQQYKGFLPLG